MPRLVATLMLLGITGLATGCGSDRPDSAGDGHRLTTVTEWRGGRAQYLTDHPDYGGEAVAASALVFAPPVTLDEPPIDLDRAARRPGAFFGYDEGSVEYYRLTVDDTQSFDGSVSARARGYGGRGSFGGFGSGSGWHDHYERRAVSERVGAIRR
jgi:hypothetical protein